MAVKLLSKTLGAYLLFSVILLIIAIPLFYLSLKQIYIGDIDETLMLNARSFRDSYLPHFTEEDVNRWNQYNRDIHIVPMEINLDRDSLFYQSLPDTLEHEMEPYRILYAPIMIDSEPYLYTAKISLVERGDMVASIGLIFVSFIIVFAVLLYVITQKFSRRIWRPFHKTLIRLKDFDLSEGQPFLVEETNIKEFSELNDSLKRLTDQNILAYNQQKIFIQNASHELQTPLAVIKSKLDMLLQRKDLTEEQSQFLSGLEMPISRMTRINKNLLLLAKIENNQFANKEQINLGDELNDTIELLSDFIESKQLTVEKEIQQHCFVESNRHLLEMLIGNLIINAVIHNVQRGKLTLILAEGCFSVINTGNAPLDRERLFQRFADRSGGSMNAGLGLAIVDSICKQNKWEITYSFAGGKHIFSVKLAEGRWS